MKTLAVLAAAATALVASTALAQSPSMAPAMAPAPMCLHSQDIDHTKAPNDRTVLIYMRDGKIWQSKLRTVCPQISFNGFSYDATPPEDLCPNVQIIRVIRTGTVCSMGPLEPYTPPPKSSM
jgi:hypothetical protein